MTKGEWMTPEEYIAMVEEENKNRNKQIEQFKKWVKAWTKIIEKLEEENENLREEIKEIEKNQEYRYHRCMVAERGGEDEE